MQVDTAEATSSTRTKRKRGATVIAESKDAKTLTGMALSKSMLMPGT